MRYVVVIVLLIISIILCSCASGGVDMFRSILDREAAVANAQMDLILCAIQNQNTEDFKALFSKNALNDVTDIDTMMEAIYAYCPAEFGAYDNWSGPNTESSFENGRRTTQMYATYDVDTETGKYRFTYMYISEDTECPANVGLWSLYVIKWEEDIDPQFAYRGDGLYTTGIQIGIQNVLPEEGA